MYMLYLQNGLDHVENILMSMMQTKLSEFLPTSSVISFVNKFIFLLYFPT
jgi:hypothetical protein